MTRSLAILFALSLSALGAPAFALGSSEPAAAAPEDGARPARPDPDSEIGPERQRLRRSFERALTQLDKGRFADAALGFEDVLAQVAWPEASYNAALARYRLLDLAAAERHAAIATAGLPHDAGAAHLLALVLSDLGRHQDALASAAAALELAPADDPGLRAQIELTSGSAQRLLGRAGAVHAYNRALELAKAAGAPRLEASAWLGIGHVAQAGGDRARASEAFAAAVAVPAGGGEAALTEVLLAEAEAGWRGGDDGVARTGVQRAVASLDASDLPPLSRAGLQTRIATLQWSLGDRQAARDRLLGAEGVFEGAGALAALADVWVTRSSWLVSTGELTQAVSLLDRALAVQGRLQVPVALASSRLARAQFMADEGDLNGALGMANKSLAVFEQIGLTEGQQGAWLMLAELKGRAGALAEAREAAITAVSFAKELANPRLAAGSRAELAVILARLGALREATAEYEKATVSTANSATLLAPRTRVRLEVEMAAAHARGRRADEGIGYARRALSIASGAGAPADLIPLGEEAVVAVLLESGKHEEAVAFLDERGITEGRLRVAAMDRRGTELFNAGVDAYTAGDYGRASARFRELLSDGDAPEERVRSARKALQDVLSAQGAAALEEGKGPRAEEVWAEATSLAHAREDGQGAATLYLLRAQLALDGGDPQRAARLGAECGEKAGSLDDASFAAQCWELAGHAAFEADPGSARTAFENALAAWASVPESVAHRAQLAYNLAVLDQGAAPSVLTQRLAVTLTLAQDAGDEALAAEVAAWIEQLETPDEP